MTSFWWEIEYIKDGDAARMDDDGAPPWEPSPEVREYFRGLEHFHAMVHAYFLPGRNSAPWARAMNGVEPCEGGD